MSLHFRAFPAPLISLFSWLLLHSYVSYGLESDVNCLRSIQSSLEDPLKSLASTWNFENSTEGFICRFTGIECWHDDENRVLNIRLSDMGLKGEFPRGIANCKSLTGLDLSSNSISGSIPSDISDIIKFVTSLDLSSNSLSGSIPVGLSNISFVNSIKLDNNQLSGQIPPEIGLLDRLKVFSVSNNQLTGPVPNFRNTTTTITAANYAQNPGLCGGPLPPCRASSKKNRTGVIVGAAVAGITCAALAVGISMFLFVRKTSKKKKEDDPEGNKWAKSIKGARGIKVIRPSISRDCLVPTISYF